MPTPSAVMSMAASLLNDTGRNSATDSAVLPYFNIALDDLQEIFEHNNIPITNETSANLALTAGDTVISFSSSPALPAALVEIQRLWERSAGTPPYVPMGKVEFIPHDQEDLSITQFLIWAWINEEIRLIATTADVDVKIDYIQSIFSTPIEIADIGTDLPVINVKQYLGYHTASLYAMFAGENETRAAILENKAIEALDRELGIPTKGRQSITTRRQPFMSSHRRRSYV